MNIFLLALIVIIAHFTVFFIIGQLLKNNSVVDIGWGLGFVVLVVVGLLTQSGANILALVISIFVSIWGLRLTYYIAKRNYKKPEDFRYQNMRKKWGNKVAINAFFKVYMLQALIMYIVAMPILVAFNGGTNEYNIIVSLGVLVWLIGFIFESVSDAQLRKFVKNNKNKGKIIKSGLWRYTRHPNYFGEATMWWGLFLIALPSELGLLAVVSPLLITYLLLYVSGVPMLEKKYENNEEFQEYKKTTSKFFPLPPKKNN